MKPTWYGRTILKLILGHGVVKSYSQFGEDAVINALLRRVKKGIYVDVGCADPVLYSNTFLFYKKGWSGICIDPNGDFKGRYALMRPRDVFIEAGVGHETEATYYAFSDETYNTFSEQEKGEYLKRKGLKVVSQKNIPIKPLKAILAGIKKIDYLNIDVQGLDLQVLETHDWSVKPTVISVEAEHFDPLLPENTPVYLFLEQKGYKLVGLCGLTLIFCLR